MTKLVIVPTPIGNLNDISVRAQEALASSDIVLCEDTRICSKLLNRMGLTKPMVCYRDDNETQQTEKILNLIADGKIVALTSDSGTPGISDPGFRVVNACRKNLIPIEVIPGPCAAITVLSASGLPSDGFLFLGFLASKSSARIRSFNKFLNFEYSLIFYESCHRIMKFLNDLESVMGPDRAICVAKEVTKLYEKFFVGKISDVRENVSKTAIKGEYTIVIAPKKFEL